MLVSQACVSFSGSAGWPIAWVGLPPGSGQSGLTAGGGRVTGMPASFGSGSTLAAEPKHRRSARRATAVFLSPPNQSAPQP